MATFEPHNLVISSRATDLAGGFNTPAAGLSALSIIGPFFALALVSNRIYWRLKKVGNVWYDDWCIIVSFAFLVAQSAAMLAANDRGYGLPSSHLSATDIDSALYYFYQVQIYYKLTINLTKASIVLLYYRIFNIRPFRACCLAILIVIAIFGVSLTATTIFQCSPTQKAYIQSTPGQCLSHLTLWRVNAVYNILSDIVIIIMPFPVLRSLSLPTGQFIGVAGILCCGIFVILTAILRFTTLSTAGHSDDPVAGTLVSTTWTEAEACVAIICACLPMMRVLLQRWLPFLRNISSRSNRSDNGADQHPSQQHHHYPASELRNYEHLGDGDHRSRSDQAAPWPIVPRTAGQRYATHETPAVEARSMGEEDKGRWGRYHDRYPAIFLA